jgi:hypothetical protein
MLARHIRHRERFPTLFSSACDSKTMKRFFLCLALVSLGAVASVRGDETIRAVQERLKAGGFYFSEVNGRSSSDTTAAITRYQIRNGLQISGKLDAATRQALGVTASESESPSPWFGREAWRYLRKTDQEYLNRLAAEEAKAPKPTASPPAKRAPAKTNRSATAPMNSERERLRDFVAAFILAGLDPEVGSETEFFADRVDYFGEKNVSRDKIRRDLQRYDNRWPKRGFWLAGELEVVPFNGKVKVSFPLRYELQNGSKHSAGKVWKTLILERTGADDLQIVSVNERKVK